MIDRVEFLKSDKMQAPVRAELEAWTTNIPVREHLRDYFARLGQVQLQVMRETVNSYLASARLIERLVREVGDPRVIPIYFIEPHDLGDGQLDLGISDPHLHGTFLITETAAVIVAFDFTELDAAAHAHARWPG